VVYHFFGLPPSASLADLAAKGQRFCDTEWAAIAAKRGSEVHVEHYCFRHGTTTPKFLFALVLAPWTAMHLTTITPSCLMVSVEPNTDGADVPDPNFSAKLLFGEIDLSPPVDQTAMLWIVYHMIRQRRGRGGGAAARSYNNLDNHSTPNNFQLRLRSNWEFL